MKKRAARAQLRDGSRRSTQPPSLPPNQAAAPPRARGAKAVPRVWRSRSRQACTPGCGQGRETERAGNLLRIHGHLPLHLRTGCNTTITATCDRASKQASTQMCSLPACLPLTAASNVACLQEEVFEGIMPPLVRDLGRGKSSLLVAMGPTGAGKSYTVLGCDSHPGLLPRALQLLFNPAPADRADDEGTTRCW